MTHVSLCLNDGAFHRDCVEDLATWLAWALKPEGLEDVRYVTVNNQIVYDAR